MPHPDYLEELLTPLQLQEWQFYAQLSPIGSQRNDVRAAIQTAYLRQAFIGKEDEPASAFMPKFPIYESFDDDEDETPEMQAAREQRERNQFR